MLNLFRVKEMNKDNEKNKKIYITFGNHMHWVDMEWMWGRGTLKNSVDDMIRFVEETGLKGAVNFEGYGYEYLAAKYPESIEKIKRMIKDKKLEICSGSFGQPYGNLCLEESNIQHLVRGVRVSEKIFGTRPKMWWEEEYCYFPQLVQLLKLTGFRCGNLFFQETWHTPFVPKTGEAVINLKSPDGSGLPFINYNDFCIHQWPEHLEKLLGGIDSEEVTIVQWLELMNSPKWMCRTELIAPVLKKYENKGYDFKALLPSEICEKKAGAERKISNYEVYQGVSLGKNGDSLLKKLRTVENKIVDTQILASMYAYLSGDYPQWNDYPDWEIDEAWNNLLIAQAHDNYECEGFCGDIGKKYLNMSGSLIEDVYERYIDKYSEKIGTDGNMIVFNPTNHERSEHVSFENEYVPVKNSKPLALEVLNDCDVPKLLYEKNSKSVKIYGPENEYTVFNDLSIMEHKTGIIMNDLKSISEKLCSYDLDVRQPSDGVIAVSGSLSFEGIYDVEAEIIFDSLNDCIKIFNKIKAVKKPEYGYRGALFVEYGKNSDVKTVESDYPFGIERGIPALKHFRKYPEDNWMTSNKKYENINNPFSGLRYAEIKYQDSSVALFNSGNQGFFMEGNKVKCSLYLYDPWDENNWESEVQVNYGFSTGKNSDISSLKKAIDFNNPLKIFRSRCRKAKGIECFAPYGFDSEMILTALYREKNNHVAHLWNQNDEDVCFTVRLPENIMKVFKSDLLNENRSELEISDAKVRVKAGKNEIISLIFLYEKEMVKNIDSYRKVWSDSRN